MSKLNYLCFCLLMSFMSAAVYSAEAQNAEVAETADTGDQGAVLEEDNDIITESSTIVTDDTVETAGHDKVASDDNEARPEPSGAANAETLETESQDSITRDDSEVAVESSTVAVTESVETTEQDTAVDSVNQIIAESSTVVVSDTVDETDQGPAKDNEQGVSSEVQTAESTQSSTSVDESLSGDAVTPETSKTSVDETVNGVTNADNVIDDNTAVITDSQADKADDSIDTDIQGPAESAAGEDAPIMPAVISADGDDEVVQSNSDVSDDMSTLETMTAVTAKHTGDGTRVPAATSGIRKGQRRPAEQFSIDLFDRPLTIGGSFDALWNQESDLAFDDFDDDYSYTQYTLSLELFYEITESVSFFADGALFYSKFDSERQTGAERYQTWVYFEEIFDSDFDIKLGAQYFSDERAWWWDDDLDAVSLQYWGEHWQAELAFTQSLARESTTEDFIDPAEEDLNRLLTRVSWEHLEDHWLEFFYVVQNDHSATESVDSSIDGNKLDDTDADLQWIGIRSYGYRDIGNNGEIDYWLDMAYMDGDETLISTADTANPAKLLVDGVSTDAVHGWAFDLGLAWHTEFPLNPSFTLGYAVGSGKLDEQGDLDTAYQQTGIQGNSNYFTDVNYIAYYGELLYPELSNLKIWMLGVSVPLLENTALDLVYHRYQQYVTADFLRNAGIDMDPNGSSRDIGSEVDIIFRALEFVHWEYGVTAAFFRAGDAFGSNAGEMATSLSFDLRYNF